MIDVEKLAERISKETHFSGRSIVLGHIQRGGNPVPEDRILASQMGKAAFDALIKGQSNVCVCKVNNEMVLKNIDHALKEEVGMKAQLYELFDDLI